MSLSVIALLGQKDHPTDAVEEYCRYLGFALQPHDIQLEIRRVPWEIHGWSAALQTLPLIAKQWRNTWVLVQYTALAWSARGFPQKFLRVLHILKSAGARVAVVFHDVLPYPGTRLVDRLRRFTQVQVMRQALTRADFAIVTVTPEKIPWLPMPVENLVFIPVGANLPVPETAPAAPQSRDTARQVAVFGITGGDAGNRETDTILAAVRHATEKLGPLKLNVFGRNSGAHEEALRRGLADLPVTVVVEDVLPAEVIVKRLSCSDVLLFVRGPISSRRGSAIAGIACGLPVIAYPGVETAAPITEAGVVLVPENDPAALNAALLRVLSDPSYRSELSSRSRAAYHSHLSWGVIASRFASVFQSRWV